MAVSQPMTLLTTGELAKRLGVPVHRIEYVISSRGIEPAARVGGIRAFDGEGVAAVERALAQSGERSTRSQNLPR